MVRKATGFSSLPGPTQRWGGSSTCLVCDEANYKRMVKSAGSAKEVDDYLARSKRGGAGEGWIGGLIGRKA